MSKPNIRELIRLKTMGHKSANDRITRRRVLFGAHTQPGWCRMLISSQAQLSVPMFYVQDIVHGVMFYKKSLLTYFHTLNSSHVLCIMQPSPWMMYYFKDSVQWFNVLIIKAASFFFFFFSLQVRAVNTSLTCCLCVIVWAQLASCPSRRQWATLTRVKSHPLAVGRMWTYHSLSI